MKKKGLVNAYINQHGGCISHSTFFPKLMPTLLGRISSDGIFEEIRRMRLYCFPVLERIYRSSMDRLEFLFLKKKKKLCLHTKM